MNEKMVEQQNTDETSRRMLEDSVERVDHSDIRNPNSVVAPYFDVEDILDKMDSLTYIELKDLEATIRSQENYIKTGTTMLNSLSEFADVAQTISDKINISDKIKSANEINKVVGGNEMQDFKVQVEDYSKNLDLIKNKLTALLEPYKDVALSASFVSSESIKTLTKKREEYQKILDSGDCPDIIESINLIDRQISLYENRSRMADIFIEETLFRNRKILKKMNRYYRTMHIKTFNEAKRGLTKWFAPSNLHIFEQVCNEKIFTDDEISIKLLILFYMILDNRKSCNSYKLDHLIIQLLIMNVLDIKDSFYDLEDTPDNFINSMKKIEWYID